MLYVFIFFCWGGGGRGRGGNISPYPSQTPLSDLMHRHRVHRFVRCPRGNPDGFGQMGSTRSWEMISHGGISFPTVGDSFPRWETVGNNILQSVAEGCRITDPTASHGETSYPTVSHSFPWRPHTLDVTGIILKALAGFRIAGFRIGSVWGPYGPLGPLVPFGSILVHWPIWAMGPTYKIMHAH